MDQLFEALSFFATETGILIISVVAGAMILFWEWRTALIGLVIVQVGVLSLSVARTGMPAQWAGLQVVVMIIIAVMLAISVVQTPTSRSLQQAGNWLLRLLAVSLIFLAWRVIGIVIPLPGFSPELIALFTWLALIVLLMLGLSDNPLFAGVALLLWFIPAQAAVAVLAPQPNLFAIIGGLEIMVALAASYLILADRLPAAERRLVMTDIVFPDQVEDALDPVSGHIIADEFIASAPLPAFLQGIVDSINGKNRQKEREPGPQQPPSTDVAVTEERN